MSAEFESFDRKIPAAPLYRNPNVEYVEILHKIVVHEDITPSERYKLRFLIEKLEHEISGEPIRYPPRPPAM